MSEIYRGYLIFRNDPLPPIPTRKLDWHYQHEDFDGPEDSRFGNCASADECRQEIDDALGPEVCGHCKRMEPVVSCHYGGCPFGGDL